MVNNPTVKGLESLLSNLRKTEKELGKMNSSLSSDLGSKFEQMKKEYSVLSERKMKLNKKQATVSLMADYSVRVVFENQEDAKDFAIGKK